MQFYSKLTARVSVMALAAAGCAPALAQEMPADAPDIAQSEQPADDVSDNVIVEKADPSGAGFGEDTWIYYLQAQRWAVIENHTGDPEWPWYVHIGSTVYETDLKGWVFTDHFADVIVKDDGVSHSVLDLDDLARGLELGLVSGSTGSEILRQTQSLVDTIREGRFPPGELSEREAWKCELSHLRG